MSLSLSFAVQSLRQAKASLPIRPTEWLVGIPEWSRWGSFPSRDLAELLSIATTRGIKLVLDADVLLHEHQIGEFQQLLSGPFLKEFYGIRCQDIGMLSFAKQKSPHLERIFLSEAKFPNTHASKELGAAGVFDRLVFGHQLSASQMLSQKKAFLRKTELPVCSPLPLLTTPRGLMSAQGLAAQEMFSAHSEESAHHHFRVLESSRTTSFFHLKDWQLFSLWDEVKSLAPEVITIDWRCLPQKSFDDLVQWLPHFFEHPKRHLETFMELYPRKTTTGFFRKNKTTVLFKKLKNEVLTDAKPRAFARVVDSQKGVHHVFEVFEGKKVPSEGAWEMLAPNGKKKLISAPQVEYLDDQGHLCKIAHQGAFPFQSLLLEPSH